MSGTISCFDIVSMVVDEATSQYSATFKVDNSKYEILKVICSIIDDITNDIDCRSFDVEVDKTTMTISISVEFLEFSCKNKKTLCNNLIRISNSFKLSVSKNGLLSARLIFPGIWTNV